MKRRLAEIYDLKNTNPHDIVYGSDDNKVLIKLTFQKFYSECNFHKKIVKNFVVDPLDMEPELIQVTH